MQGGTERTNALDGCLIGIIQASSPASQMVKHWEGMAHYKRLAVVEP